MNPLFRGVSTGQTHGPTMKSARRMANLSAALHEINRRPVGIDGIGYEGYADPLGYLRWNPNLLDAHPDLQPLKDLQESLVYDYLPDPALAIRLGQRVVECSTVASRIIERALARKLSRNLDRYFNHASYGYRPGRSPQDAILRVREAVRQGAHWALKTDIQHFFQSIDRQILEHQVREIIADQSLCAALLAATSPVLIFRGNPLYRQNGLPEGNGISPILSNIYLHGLDDACSELKYFRYADDLLVLGHTREEVQKAREYVRHVAGGLKLQLNQQKTFICDLYKNRLVFLGYLLRGGNVYPPQQAIFRFRRKLEFRGPEDRQRALMWSFVRTYSIGPVRKLFRRLDRDLNHLYPPGLTLVRVLDVVRAKVTVKQ